MPFDYAKTQREYIQTKMLACTLEVDEAEVLKAVSLYTNALMLLDQYDHQSLKKPTGSKAIYRITYEDCRNMVNAMEDSFHSDVFGIAKENCSKEAFIAAKLGILNLHNWKNHVFAKFYACTSLIFWL